MPPFLALPHVVIAMRNLRQRAWMNFDRLCNVHLDAVTCLAQNGICHVEKDRVGDEVGGMG
ncbi:hypothetical protein K663_20113 (plasmid) [Sphingobium sp. MI1205]|nr:hypothetical protein K663_20113 [Sphingobium sp. MI1205]